MAECGNCKWRVRAKTKQSSRPKSTEREVLESYNPSDVFNQQNRKRDVFAKEKLGADVAGADLVCKIS